MINIAKLLKDAPKGMKLYSPLLGEVEFAEVMDTDYLPIRVMKRGYGLRFDEYGRYMGNEYPDSECLLFPSKDCRTWEGWKPPVKPKFKVADWIVRNNGSSDVPIQVYGLKKDRYLVTNMLGSKGEVMLTCQDKWRLWTIQDAKDGDVLAFDWTQDDGTSHWEKIVIFKKYHAKGVKGLFNSPCVEGYGNTFKNGKLALQEEVPYYSKTWTMTLQPATKEQRDLLFAKMREAGYEWDAGKKELRKIQPHYDIANFYAGMPVLVRADYACRWDYSVFSRITGNEDWKFAVCNGVSFTQCIPFNDDTKHLLGTTDMCDEMYINW